MSEPLPAQAAARGEPAPPQSQATGSAMAALAIDVAIVFAAMITAMLFLGTCWGVVRGIALAREGVAAAEMTHRMGEPGVLFQIFATIVSMGAATALLILWRRRPTPQERARSLSALRRRSTWGWALATGILTTVVSTALTMAAAAFGIEPDPSNEVLIRDLASQYPWLLLPFAVVLAPLYEEFLFRRGFFGRLQAAGRPMAGLVVSAGLFALLHEIPGVGGNSLVATAVLWLVYASMGVGFALVYRRCGTIWAAVGAHATHNLLACVVFLNQMQ